MGGVCVWGSPLWKSNYRLWIKGNITLQESINRDFSVTKFNVIVHQQIKAIPKIQYASKPTSK